jgi:tRNA-splicing ligase RtcB
MSRKGATQHAAGRNIARELKQRGIVVRARGKKELAEEQPDAYKDVNVIVEAVAEAGLSHKVARLRAFGVIKG